jgi:hypothetical protein
MVEDEVVEAVDELVEVDEVNEAEVEVEGV